MSFWRSSRQSFQWRRSEAPVLSSAVASLVARSSLRSCVSANIEFQIPADLFLFRAFEFKSFDKRIVSPHDIDEHASGPCERKQSGNSNDGADNAVLRVEVHLAVAERSVGVGAKIDGILRGVDQAEMPEHNGPPDDADNVKREEKEDGGAEKKERGDNVRAPGAQSEFAAFVNRGNPMDTHSVEEHEGHQNDGADDDGRGKREFSWDLTHQLGRA